MSQEADNDAPLVETVQEIEYVWYLKLIDFNQLTNAPHKESHFQAEYWLFDDEGKERIGVIRSREIDSGERHELTVKSYSKDHDGAMETTLVGNSASNAAMTRIAQRIVRKVRYRYPTGTPQGDESTGFFEVDVFILADGSNYPWVKVDFEVPNKETPVPTLPFKYSESIAMGSGPMETKLSDAQVKILHELHADTNLRIDK